MTFAWRVYLGAIDDVPALLGRVAQLPAPVQIARADRVCGPDHVAHAARIAQRAWDAGAASASSLPAEFARVLAGERQVSKALAKLGVAKGAPGAQARIVAVAFGEHANTALEALARSEGWRVDEAPLACTREALAALGVSEAELAQRPADCWEDFALERVALADLAR